MILTEISAFGNNMMVASYVALLSAFAWLIVTQIKTNKTFADAINEFRVTIQLLNFQNQNQVTTCQRHRQETDANREKLTEIEKELTRLRQLQGVKNRKASC